jgi:hypothetical protein
MEGLVDLKTLGGLRLRPSRAKDSAQDDGHFFPTKLLHDEGETDGVGEAGGGAADDEVVGAGGRWIDGGGGAVIGDEAAGAAADERGCHEKDEAESCERKNALA